MERHWALCVIFFLVLYLVQAQDPIGFINLDCGLPVQGSPYKESSTGLAYTSDDGAVHGGKLGRINKELESLYNKPEWTLRYFPDGIRNCYNVNVTRDSSYLVKASFVYGNYDGLNIVPDFDLYFGPNIWATISSNDTIKEIIHVMRSNSFQVCLVKTGTSIPMISRLEVRPLNNSSYPTESGSLKFLFRRYFSSSGDYIGYPDDVYDRRWYPMFLEKRWKSVTTDLNVNTTNTYNPPQKAVATAATSLDANAPWNITWSVEPPSTKFYLYIHFAELQSLGSNNTREFNVMLNGNLYFGPYSPKPLKIETIYGKTPDQCDGGECILQLEKTTKSTLPPLTKAIYFIKKEEV